MSGEALIAKFEALPPAAQKQVEALVEKLSAASQKGPAKPLQKRLRFDWAGGLEELKAQHDGVSLQHHISELR